MRYPIAPYRLSSCNRQQFVHIYVCGCVGTYLYDTSMMIICDSSIGKCETWHLHLISLWANLDRTKKKTHTEKKSCRLWLLLLLLCLFFLLCLLCLRPRFLREFIFIFCTHCSCPLARTHTHTRLGQLHLALLAASNQVQGRATRTARMGVGRRRGRADSWRSVMKAVEDVAMRCAIAISDASCD